MICVTYPHLAQDAAFNSELLIICDECLHFGLQIMNPLLEIAILIRKVRNDLLEACD